MLRADVELPSRMGFSLFDIIGAFRDAGDGTLVSLTLDDAGRTDLERWSALTRHLIVDVQLLPDGATRLVVRKGDARVEPPAQGRRLWLYSNFDCNLACDYCCVRSSPQTERRALSAERVSRLTREAAAKRYDAAYITGGEPFLRPDIGEVILAAATHLPTTVLTNAMLFRGSKLGVLDRLPRDRVTLQVSMDSPTAEVHDAHRGAGSWARALEGIDIARKMGFRVRIAATTTSETQMRDMDQFLAARGVPPEDRVIRPLARRGSASEGVVITRRDLQPELTATAVGWYWHPVGATDDDLRIAGPEMGLDEAMAVMERTIEADRLVGERIAKVFPCA